LEFFESFCKSFVFSGLWPRNFLVEVGKIQTKTKLFRKVFGWFGGVATAVLRDFFGLSDFLY
jgi:hypothetical protein